VEDQGDLGSCTANGFAGIIELNEVKAGRKLSEAASVPIASISNIQVAANGFITYLTTVVPPAPAPTPTPTPIPTPAKLIQVGRLAHYYFTRQIEGTTSEDSGATIRDTIKAGYTYGVSDESLWPYDTTKYLSKPPQSVYTAAAAHKVTSYHSIADGDLNTIKSAIAAGYAVTFGFDVYDYFMSQDMATKAMLSVPKSSESLQGGHCVDKVGYNDSIGPFPDGTYGGTLCRNSWGKNWGIAGYFWMSYSYILKQGLASDYWVVQSSPV
jgi:C1A family cysteine protease